MNKLSIALLIAGTAAATGFVVTKMLQKKKAENDMLNGYDDLDALDDELDEALDVIIPDEDDCEDCAEDIAEAVEEAAEEIK